MDVVGADRYNLTIFPPGIIFTTNETSYTLADLDPGTNYSISVQALSPMLSSPLGSLESVSSSVIQVTTGKLVF